MTALPGAVRCQNCTHVGIERSVVIISIVLNPNVPICFLKLQRWRCVRKIVFYAMTPPQRTDISTYHNVFSTHQFLEILRPNLAGDPIPPFGIKKVILHMRNDHGLPNSLRSIVRLLKRAIQSSRDSDADIQCHFIPKGSNVVIQDYST